VKNIFKSNMGIASDNKNFPRGGRKPAAAVLRKGYFRVSLQKMAFHVFHVHLAHGASSDVQN
jgi:hypothetical protein